VTEVADPSTAAPSPPRRARAATTDLSYRVDRALVERWASDEPAWLADERRRALVAFEALPIEPNRLYTPYVDLRAAVLDDVRPYEEPEGSPPTAPRVGAPSATAQGLAALAAFEEDRVAAIDIGEDARRAGVSVEPLGALIGRDPDTARRLLVDDAQLPADDKLAQLSLAAWNQGVAVRVPAGVVLDAPIVVRWAAGAPGRALHVGRSSSWARAPRRAWSRSRAVGRSRPAARRCSRPRRRSGWAPTRGWRWPASRSSGRTRSCSSSDAR
jgi:hypothetical protein